MENMTSWNLLKDEFDWKFPFQSLSFARDLHSGACGTALQKVGFS